MTKALAEYYYHNEGPESDASYNVEECIHDENVHTTPDKVVTTECERVSGRLAGKDVGGEVVEVWNEVNEE